MYYMQDANYNVIGIVDEAGDVKERYNYAPYGDITITDAGYLTFSESPAGNTLTFQGRRLDTETGLYYYRNRYYSPALGRFMQRDLMGYVDGMNLYEFVGGMVHLSDPLGLFLTWGNYNSPTHRAIVRPERANTPPSPKSTSSIANALISYARQLGLSANVNFSVKFMRIPLPPTPVVIEGHVIFSGGFELCCHVDDQRYGAQLRGSVTVRVSGGIGTTFGVDPKGRHNSPTVYDERGTGSKWRDTASGEWTTPPQTPSTGTGASASINSGIPVCKNALSLSIDIGIYAFVGFGVGPEAEIKYTIGLYQDPGGLSWSVGIGTGTGARIEVFGAGNASGTLVVY